MASPSETIIWTALPYARTATTLKLSAYVTFQLSGDTTVLNPALFPVAASWDATQLEFGVLVPGSSVPITPTSTSQSQIQPALWKLLVPSQIPLPLVSWDKYVQAATGKTFATFDAAAIGSYLTQLQANHVTTSFGTTPTLAERALDPLIKVASLPSILSKSAPATPKTPAIKTNVKSGTPKLAITRAGLISAAAKNIVVQRMKGTPPTTLESQLIEAHNFFNPNPVALSDPPVYLPIPKPTFPNIDFHQAMSLVGQHFQLMRLLGVVVDLEIPLGSVPATGMISLSVRPKSAAARPSVAGGGRNSVTTATSLNSLNAAASWQFPQTAFELGSDYFRPAPKPSSGAAPPSDYLAGFLNMPPSVISVGCLDLAGGVLKTTAFATKIVESAAILELESKALPIVQQTSPQPTATNPPYQRTSGISVYKTNRLASFSSLRTMALKSISALPSSGTGATSGAAAGVGPFYADDLLKGWRPDFLHQGKQGSQWLSVNQRINFYRIASTMLGPFTDESQISISLSSDTSTATTQYLSESLFSWSGWSLAVPQPGAPLTDSGARTPTPAISNATDAQAYLNSYVIGNSKYPLATVAFAPPGSLPLLRFGDTYSVRARYADLAGNSLPISAPNPSSGVTSQSLTYLRQEPIGPPALFPTKKIAGFGASAYILVVRKYADGTIDKPELRQVVPALGDVSFAELHGMLDTAAGLPDPSVYALVQQFDNTPPLPTYIPESSNPPLPYLPDPTSQGACLVTTSNVSLPVQLINFYTGATWPHPHFGTMTLTAGTAASTTGSNGTNLAVTLAPGQRVYFNLSSSTSGNYLADFQQTWALENALQAANKSIVPVLNTKFPVAAVKAKTFAKSVPFNMVSIKTNLAPITPIDKIQHVDTGPSPEQIYVQSFINGRNLAFTPPVPVTMIYATQVPEPGLQVGRIVANRQANYTKATFTILPQVHGWSTEEIEYFFTFVDDTDLLSESQRTTTEITRSNRAFSIPVPYVDQQPINALNNLAAQPYEFHDTKTHTVNVLLVAKTRYVSCFPPSWSSNVATPIVKNAVTPIKPSPSTTHPFTVSLKAPQPVIVPSSRRPDSVAIEAVLPTFQWTQESSGNTTYSARKGNTIRVFLRRPWFSSGNGEQVAVILGTNLASEGELPPFVTLIGTDPAFQNPPINQFLTVDNFPNRDGTASGTGAPAIKESSEPVVAALYNPVFDTFHQMWVVDIEIDPPTSNAYTPFVRLALARYQTNSLAGMNVSSIAITDITQLHASRLATLQVLQPKKAVSVSLTATAVAQSFIGKNVVVGTLEEKIGPDPDTGWTPALDAQNNVIENIIPLNQGNTIAPVIYKLPTVSPKIGALTLEKRVFAPVSIDKSGSVPVTVNTPSGPGIFDLPDSSQTYRIVVREYELHDSGSAEPSVYEVTGTNKDLHVTGRLVHVDAISVP